MQTPQNVIPKNPGPMHNYIQKIVTKHPDLEQALRKEGIKESAYDFVKRMLMFSVIFTISIGAVAAIMLVKLLHNTVTGSVLALMVALAAYNSIFRSFMNFPTAKGKSSSKKVERDIIFAARDLIIALRSGMPLFNAITSVSSGYGEASKEFLKIVEKVQLGMPLEDAIDETVSSTHSPSFRKIMLQASVSIRVGADVTSALQSVIDQLTQERVIELRRYGQRLNAIAMFYMLFGIILPSMGIAVLTILTTFIPIFSVDATLLEVVIVGLIFLQVVFLQMIRSSRPVFTL
jgi:pilus assembly protein TadC